MDSGEFHAENDFSFLSEQPAWGVIREENEILIEKQLTWSIEDQSGIQRLFDHRQGLLWEKTVEQDDWQLKSGSLETTEYPSPEVPYQMTMPKWLEALSENLPNR